MNQHLDPATPPVEGRDPPGCALVAEDRGRPLVHWGDADRDQVARRVAEPLRTWRAAWDAEGKAGTVVCRPPDADSRAGLVEAAWARLGGETSGAWWTVRSQGDDAGEADPGAAAVEAIAVGLFPERPGSLRALAREGSPDEPSVAAEVARRAWLDLLERFTHALKIVEGSVEARAPCEGAAEALRPWSGGMLVSSSLWSVEVMLLFSPGATARILGRAAPMSVSRRGAAPSSGLAPVLGVLATRSLPTRVQLHPLELPLGALMELREGDVLCTEHPLEAPLNVHLVDELGAAGQPVAQGFMGRVGATLALELEGAPAALLGASLATATVDPPSTGRLPSLSPTPEGTS